MREYMASVRPKPESLSIEQIKSIAPADMAGLLAEWSARDYRLWQRLTDLIATAGQRPAAGVVAEKGSSPNPSYNYMVGASPAMMQLFEAIRRYAEADAPVLITGESGTGKELAARAVHERSPFSKGPFVAINCGALPVSLIASELFGYEKGAFTGATTRKIGRIEAAKGGTIFLDEIGDLPLETQAHLLRFLQEKTIERIGGTATLTIDARVIAATHVNLEEAVARRRFREDLFYRLNVLPLSMPPLRARGDDILLLVHYFLQRFSEEMGREALSLAPEAETVIVNYPWPGNVRELISCIRRSVVMATGPTIQVADLGVLRDPKKATAPSDVSSESDLVGSRNLAEAMSVREVLARNRFNIKRSALDLGVSRVTLYRLIHKHNIMIERESRALAQ